MQIGNCVGKRLHLTSITGSQSSTPKTEPLLQAFVRPRARKAGRAVRPHDGSVYVSAKMKRITLPYSGADMSLLIDRVLEAERLGFDSVWTSEAYGSDAVTPAAWLLARTTRIKVGTAIMQMPARTPAMTAMTAMTLDAPPLSHQRASAIPPR